MNMLFYDFALISGVVVFSLSVYLVFSLKSPDYKYKKQLCPALAMAIAASILYTVFLFVRSYRAALILNTGYFILTTWMALCMLMFSMKYSGTVKHKRQVALVFGTGSILDAAILTVNVFHPFMYDIERTMFAGNECWKVNIYNFHWIHLLFCYVMVTFSYVLLLGSILKKPEGYKKKYFSILMSYVFVIIANFISYNYLKILDISVPMYAILAGFINHFSSSYFPRKLTSMSLQQILERTEMGVISYDAENTVVFHNKKADKIFSDGNGGLNATAAVRFKVDYDEELRKAAENFRRRLPSDLDNRSWWIDGKERTFAIERENIFTNINAGSFFKFLDRTEEMAQLKKQIYAATHDPLTGIFNSENFFTECDYLLKEEPSVPRVMVCSNVIDFKLINQYFGEDKGDEVLKKQAELLRNFSSHNSIYGRITDDKFAVLVREKDLDKQKLLDCMERLSHVTDSSSYVMRIQCGIATFHGTENAHELYDRAKLAMDSGRENYSQTFFTYDTNLMEKLLAEKKFLSSFEYALSNNCIIMDLQPVVDRTGAIRGAEALARWKNPVSTRLYEPVEFIEPLEKSGLIHRLDTFMWEQAARKLSEWREKGYLYLSISVNVSRKDFHYIDIYQVFSDLLKKYSFDPSSMCIEFSETILTEDFQRYRELFKKLQSLGFKIAIDNFGSGYSSLNVLKDLDISILKIDSAFLQEQENHERNRTILNFIISTARSLSLQVVTEGIETESQKEMVQGMGSDYLQGFLISKPLTEEDFEEKYIK